MQIQWQSSCAEPRSGTAWTGWKGEHKDRVFPSRRQSQRAATGSLEEKVLPLLRYWLSSRVKNVLMLCRYRAATSHFSFQVKLEMKFSMGLARTCYLPKPRSLLRSIFGPFIGLWVILRHRNKSACSKSNPVQSSRSKSTTCPRKGCLLSVTLLRSQLEMVARKSLETNSGTILNQ